MFRIAAMSCAVLLISVASSRGEVVITFSQSGANVLAQGTGTLDIASLTLAGHGDSGGFVTPNQASVGVGSFNTNDLYTGFTGPTSFGPAGFTNASSGTGDIEGIEGSGDMFLITPEAYTSGTALSGNATWDNTTISDLGLTPGTYTWNWGSGATADSLEVVIPGAAPEPDSMILAAVAIGVFVFGAWIRRRRPA